MLRTEKLPGFDDDCVLAKGISLENLPGPGESSIVYIQPCASFEGRINCEFHFGVPGRGLSDNLYDFRVLSRVLDLYGDKFAETRVSSNLGIARVQWRGKKILVSKNGKVVVREAVDEEDAKGTVGFLSKLLSPAVNCIRCGRVLLECATASCSGCGAQQVSFQVAPNTAHWTEGLLSIRSLAIVLDEVRDSLEKDVVLGEALQSFESLLAQCYRASQVAVDLIVDSSTREELAVGILLLRQTWDLSLILESFDNLRRYGSSEKIGIPKKDILRLLGLWLLAIKHVLDGISDSEARASSPVRWAEFHEARRVLGQEVGEDSALKVVLSPLIERWPEAA